MLPARSSWVITVRGPDRRGILERLARTIADHGGNWEESRMARLAGRFTGILRVSAPSERADRLLSEVRVLGAGGIDIHVERAEEDPLEDHRTLRLSLLGGDREGIVRDVVRALVERGVNIEEFDTDTRDAPWSGGMLFQMRALLKSPAGVGVEELRRHLEKIADDLAVEVTLMEEPSEPSP